ncbi:hypothetical protein GCM10027413_17040 [Conyzicola nivalis]|uniref:Uncharacterized protein n=1 Tax=Conyzicola nivalis TaxID=1477021 RepID=A0A916SFX4_9MICO|nr:hypothetical protein GCM10010979_09580 [Conyzicola nivalis]
MARCPAAEWCGRGARGASGVLSLRKGRRGRARLPLGNGRRALGNREDASARPNAGVASLCGQATGARSEARAAETQLEAFVLDIAFILGVVVLVAIVALVGWGAQKL